MLGTGGLPQKKSAEFSERIHGGFSDGTFGGYPVENPKKIKKEIMEGIPQKLFE